MSTLPTEAMITLQMTRDEVLAMGLAYCASCGYPPNNHFEHGARLCAHTTVCTGYVEKVRFAASAPEPGPDYALAAARGDRLWQLCVDEGFPWSDCSVQDALTEIGLLYRKDMTAEDSGPACDACESDCDTCFRAVDRLIDATPASSETKAGDA